MGGKSNKKIDQPLMTEKLFKEIVKNPQNFENILKKFQKQIPDIINTYPSKTFVILARNKQLPVNNNMHILDLAVLYQNIEMAKTLLTNGAKPLFFIKGHSSPIGYAIEQHSKSRSSARNVREQIVLCFINSCSLQELNAIDGLGLTPLHYAVIYKSEVFIKQLIELKVNIEVPSVCQGKEPYAALELYLDSITHDSNTRQLSYSKTILQMLFENGATCNVAALDLALDLGDQGLVEYLLEQKKNFRMDDTNIASATKDWFLLCAERELPLNIVKKLLEQNLNPNQIDSQGFLPLSYYPDNQVAIDMFFEFGAYILVDYLDENTHLMAKSLQLTEQRISNCLTNSKETQNEADEFGLFPLDYIIIACWDDVLDLNVLFECVPQKDKEIFSCNSIFRGPLFTASALLSEDDVIRLIQLLKPSEIKLDEQAIFNIFKVLFEHDKTEAFWDLFNFLDNKINQSVTLRLFDYVLGFSEPENSEFLFGLLDNIDVKIFNPEELKKIFDLRNPHLTLEIVKKQEHLPKLFIFEKGEGLHVTVLEYVIKTLFYDSYPKNEEDLKSALEAIRKIILKEKPSEQLIHHLISRSNNTSLNAFLIIYSSCKDLTKKYNPHNKGEPLVWMIANNKAFLEEYEKEKNIKDLQVLDVEKNNLLHKLFKNISESKKPQQKFTEQWGIIEFLIKNAKINLGQKNQYKKTPLDLLTNQNLKDHVQKLLPKVDSKEDQKKPMNSQKQEELKVDLKGLLDKFNLKNLEELNHQFGNLLSRHQAVTNCEWIYFHSEEKHEIFCNELEIALKIQKENASKIVQEPKQKRAELANKFYDAANKEGIYKLTNRMLKVNALEQSKCLTLNDYLEYKSNFSIYYATKVYLPPNTIHAINKNQFFNSISKQEQLEETKLKNILLKYNIRAQKYLLKISNGDYEGIKSLMEKYFTNPSWFYEAKNKHENNCSIKTLALQIVYEVIGLWFDCVSTNMQGCFPKELNQLLEHYFQKDEQLYASILSV